MRERDSSSANLRRMTTLRSSFAQAYDNVPTGIRNVAELETDDWSPLGSTVGMFQNLDVRSKRSCISQVLGLPLVEPATTPYDYLALA